MQSGSHTQKLTVATGSHTCRGGWVGKGRSACLEMLGLHCRFFLQLRLSWPAVLPLTAWTAAEACGLGDSLVHLPGEGETLSTMCTPRNRHAGLPGQAAN